VRGVLLQAMSWRATPFFLFVLAGALCVPAAAALDTAPEKLLCATKPSHMTALRRVSTQARPVPARERVILQLAPDRTVMLPGDSDDLARERARSRGATFAGVVQLHAARPGTYRIGVDRAAWLDVVTASGQVIDPAQEEGEFDCDGAQKVIVYQLPATGTYWLQIALSPRREILLTVIPSD
jgi:hypothetical protein